MSIKNNQYKLAAYADDILLFLTDPITTIPNLLNDFSLVKSLSNLQINFFKSKALNVTLPDPVLSHCQANFTFGWEKHAITYLGIQLPVKLVDLYPRNFLPILNTIRKDLHDWNKDTFSWFGRASILKINILPRLLYLLQTVPIRLPPSFFTTYKNLCLKFIWADKNPRIRWEKLVTPKLKGGIGLPDIQIIGHAIWPELLIGTFIADLKTGFE